MSNTEENKWWLKEYKCINCEGKIYFYFDWEVNAWDIDIEPKQIDIYCHQCRQQCFAYYSIITKRSKFILIDKKNDILYTYSVDGKADPLKHFFDFQREPFEEPEDYKVQFV